MKYINLKTEFFENLPISYTEESERENILQELSELSDFYNIIDDELKTLDKYKILNSYQTYKNILILGIGGSMLGPQVLGEVFAGYNSQYVAKSGKKLFYIDNTDPFLMERIIENLKDGYTGLGQALKNTLVIVQSKSGTTIETLSQFVYLQGLFEKEKLDSSKNTLIVTDKGSYLDKLESLQEIPKFYIPAKLGGRFSVLGSVGLVLAKLIGIDLEEFLTGAKNVDLETAFKIADIQYYLYQNNFDQAVFMPYSSCLKLLANWYTQLLGESLGKTKPIGNDQADNSDHKNNKYKDSKSENSQNLENHGITPITACGATDQHSLLQLLSEGKNDKLIMFLEVENTKEIFVYKDLDNKNKDGSSENGPENQTASQKPNSITQEILQSYPYLNNLDFNTLIKAQLAGTRQSLSKLGKPNLTIVLSKIKPASVAQLFILLEISVAVLGKKIGVDPFNQPGVELSKQITRKILQS